jgi:hypothetical protein
MSLVKIVYLFIAFKYKLNVEIELMIVEQRINSCFYTFSKE